MQQQQLISHVVSAFQQATMHTNPFEHIVIENFLPQEIFDQLADVIKNTHTGAKDDRFLLAHQLQYDTRKSKDHPEFWKEWYNVFESDEVIDTLKNIFGIDDIEFTHFHIHKSQPGYTLNTHTDNKPTFKDMVSFQLYVTENDPDNGVSLWNDDRNNGGTIQNYIENKPNTAWMFKCNNSTWHSVEKCTTDRHSLLIRYCCNTELFKI